MTGSQRFEQVLLRRVDGYDELVTRVLVECPGRDGVVTPGGVERSDLQLRGAETLQGAHHGAKPREARYAGRERRPRGKMDMARGAAQTARAANAGGHPHY